MPVSKHRRKKKINHRIRITEKHMIITEKGIDAFFELAHKEKLTPDEEAEYRLLGIMVFNGREQPCDDWPDDLKEIHAKWNATTKTTCST